MRRFACIASLAAGLAWVLGAGCGPPEAPAPVAEGAPHTVDPEDVLTMRGIDLYLHDATVTGAEARRPHFWVHAERFSMSGEEVWTFEEARAVAYHRESAEEDIVFEAQRGMFEEDARAYLGGGVTARMGEMVLHLEDIEWLQGDGTTPSRAHSDKGLRVDDPKMQLQAAGIHIRPEERLFEMSGVSGVIRFGSSDDGIEAE